jgi:hypothetical protein
VLEDVFGSKGGSKGGVCSNLYSHGECEIMLREPKQENDYGTYAPCQ